LREAVSIFDRLARKNPQPFARPLASARIFLAGLLVSCGEAEAALGHLEAALQTQQRLHEKGVSEVTASLALGFQTRGLALEQLGRLNESSRDLQDAEALHQRLATERPELFAPLLAKNQRDLERVSALRAT